MFGGEVRVNFLALSASKPHFHVRSPQIVRNCSRERSLEHCHSHAFLVPNFWPAPKTPRFGPPEKVYLPHFLGKDATKGTHINFWGEILGVKTGSQTSHGWPQKV